MPPLRKVRGEAVLFHDLFQQPCICRRILRTITVVPVSVSGEIIISCGDRQIFSGFQIINGDIHCNLSPDGNYIIGDGYDFGGYRSLQGYSMKTGVARELLKAKTMPPACTDIRCDLHAQFVWGGKYISYDTTENGKREIALIPTDILDF